MSRRGEIYVIFYFCPNYIVFVVVIMMRLTDYADRAKGE